MMFIYGATFVTTDYQLQYLAGFVTFGLAGFGLLYLDEKRSGSKNPDKTLSKKLILGCIGGLIFAGTLAYVYMHLGRLWAIGYFSVSTTIFYEIQKKYSKANKEELNKEKES